MTAYTSADGFVRAASGLLSGVVVSGRLPGVGSRSRWAARRAASWLGGRGLAPSCVATLAFQVQFQLAGRPVADSRRAMDSGPWKGIALTPPQRGCSIRFAADLARRRDPATELLAYPQGGGLYLYWPGEVAANTYQLYVDDAESPLPKATVSYYRRHREVPDAGVHLTETAGKTAAQLRAESGGLEYPPVLVAPGTPSIASRRPSPRTRCWHRLPRL